MSTQEASRRPSQVPPPFGRLAKKPRSPGGVSLLGDGSAKSYPSGIDFADHNQPFLLYDDKLLRVRRFDPESIPVTSSGNSSEDDAVETGLTGAT